MRLVLLCLVSTLALGCAPAEHEQQQADPDTFSAWMDTAWDETLKHASGSDEFNSLSRTYGQTMVDYYFDHRKSELGLEAGRHGFTMWSNVGAVEEADAALARLSDDDPLWGKILTLVYLTYGRSEARTSDDFTRLLRELRPRLTHPAAQSAVLSELARGLRSEERSEEARTLLQQVVNLNAEPFDVDQALAWLRQIESLNVGQAAPSFSAETLDGKTFELTDEPGRYVLIEFWSTWCGPCIPEIATLARLRRTYSESELQIVSVASDDSSNVSRMVREKGITWPQIVEDASFSGEVTRSYGIRSLPSSYLIAPNGTIVDKHLTGDDLLARVAGLLNRDGRKTI